MTSATKLKKYESANLPLVIFEDSLPSAQRLSAELLKWNIVVSAICDSLPKLREQVSKFSSAMFAIDVDMGANRHEEGIEAIRLLRKAEREFNSSFYVAVLTSHEEFKLKAAQVGANVFLEKSTIQTDALELVTRMLQYQRDMEQIAPDKPQTQLALREYEELARQLKAVKKSPARGLEMPIKTVQRALSWPFLMPNEKLVLTALYTQLRSASEHSVDQKTIDLCLKGVNLLTKDRARNSSVKEWLESARRHSPDFTLSWLDEDFFDEQEDETHSTH